MEIMMNNEEKFLIQNEFVKHVLKYRPNCVTARLAKEVIKLRKKIKHDN
jgi:hypothetical protein